MQDRCEGLKAAFKSKRAGALDVVGLHFKLHYEASRVGRGVSYAPRVLNCSSHQDLQPEAYYQGYGGYYPAMYGQYQERRTLGAPLRECVFCCQQALLPISSEPLFCRLWCRLSTTAYPMKLQLLISAMSILQSTLALKLKELLRKEPPEGPYP